MSSPPSAFFGSKSAKDEAGIYAITATDIDGRAVPMSKFKGKALLIVNSASACGFTPQQAELAALAKQYKGKVEILLQPCNQFGGQDPGNNAQIKKFAAGNGVGVGGAGIMLAKADVNGGDATPLFAYLKAQKGGLLTADVKWNFTKFLVSPKGEGVKERD
jgi:glutathione peroxidase